MSNPHASWPPHRGLFRPKQIFPELEATPDISRAEQRFAAEVALAQFHAELIPTWVQERAMQILSVLANL